jgi:hypothetical protein
MQGANLSGFTRANLDAADNLLNIEIDVAG